MAAFVQRVLTVAVCLVLPLPCVAVPGWHADTPATWRYRRRRCGGWWTVAGRRVMGVVRIVLLRRVRWRRLATAVPTLLQVVVGASRRVVELVAAFVLLVVAVAACLFPPLARVAVPGGHAATPPGGGSGDVGTAGGGCGEAPRGGVRADRAAGAGALAAAGDGGDDSAVGGVWKVGGGRCGGPEVFVRQRTGSREGVRIGCRCHLPYGYFCAARARPSVCPISCFRGHGFGHKALEQRLRNAILTRMSFTRT